MPDPYWEKVAADVQKARAERDRDAAYQKSNSERRESAARKKKYLCASCKAENMEPWMIRTRAAKPRCPSCGSLAYEPKTKAAKEDIADLKDVRKALDGPKGTGGSGFVIGQ